MLKTKNRVWCRSQRRATLSTQNDPPGASPSALCVCVESQMMAVLSSGERHYLLKGHFDTLPVIQSRVVRIYISSGLYGNITAPRLYRASILGPRCCNTLAAASLWRRQITDCDRRDRRTDGH